MCHARWSGKAIIDWTVVPGPHREHTVGEQPGSGLGHSLKRLRYVAPVGWRAT